MNMVQQENYTADGLTAENLIVKDPSADLPEPSKYCEQTPIELLYIIIRS